MYTADNKSFPLPLDLVSLTHTNEIFYKGVPVAKFERPATLAKAIGVVSPEECQNPNLTFTQRGITVRFVTVCLNGVERGDTYLYVVSPHSSGVTKVDSWGGSAR
jgi:hypothetical protein